LLAGAAAIVAAPAPAADVTAERLINADKEPQNWLMNHRTYDAQRFSPLARISKDNVKSLKLAYAVAIGGTSANENLQATPLAEDGYLYVVDQWGVVYKIDGRSGDAGRIVWRMDPGQEKLPLSKPRCRALGQSRDLQRQLSAAHHRHQQGQRQSRLGGKPQRRPARPAAHCGAARGQG
jgi:alcohol dehydrogenase (cytochrome c)